MKKIALGVEYQGQHFAGWQRQIGQRTVQETLEKALMQVADHPVLVTAAGRTDRGVHALNQVVHFETTADRSERAWILGCNTQLPADMNVRWSACVPHEFHARHSATARTYHYWIYNDVLRSSVLQTHTAWYYQPLDCQRMQAAAAHWLGRHDFSAFRASHCQAATPLRHIHAFKVQRYGRLIRCAITANAFLYHMVRNFIGVLVRIGSGRAEPVWAKKVLLGRDRRKAAETAPSEGLYLTDIHYDPRYKLPNTPRHEMEKLLQSLS